QPMSLVLTAHYIVAVGSIVFNIVLLRLSLTKTPRHYRHCAILVCEECTFELLSSIANLVSMQRLIPIPSTSIFGSMGVCTAVSPYFCYYFHVLTVGFFCSALFISLFQFVYR
ncbi:hypothetical protein PFISCL1PPCAC_2776, partial [Pristionchus fissidentatus]